MPVITTHNVTQLRFIQIPTHFFLQLAYSFKIIKIYFMSILGLYIGLLSGAQELGWLVGRGGIHHPTMSIWELNMEVGS